MIVRTRKLSDKKLVEVIAGLFDIISDAKVSGTYLGGAQFSASSKAELSNISAKSSERIIHNFVVTLEGPSDEVRFGRGLTANYSETDPQRAFSAFRQRIPDSHFDEIAIFELPNRHNAQNYRAFDAETSLAVARFLDKLRAPIGPNASKESAGLEALLSQNLADLQETTRKFLEQSAEARAADEAAYAKRLNDLQKEFDEKNAELEARRKNLEQIREEMDDREPQHERRRLRRDLTADLRTFLEKPPEGGFAYQSGPYLFYVFFGSIFILISVLLTLRVDLATDVGGSAFWANTIKAGISGVGGAAFIWAGLAGLRASTEKQRQFSQQLQRYSFDMDRASWVVETLLQMNSIESAQVPDVWLEAVCRELFANERSDEPANESLSALAALLDATARAKVGTNGFEFELNKQAARKLSKQA